MFTGHGVASSLRGGEGELDYTHLWSSQRRTNCSSLGPDNFKIISPHGYISQADAVKLESTTDRHKNSTQFFVQFLWNDTDLIKSVAIQMTKWDRKSCAKFLNENEVWRAHDRGVIGIHLITYFAMGQKIFAECVEVTTSPSHLTIWDHASISTFTQLTARLRLLADLDFNR